MLDKLPAELFYRVCLMALGASSASYKEYFSRVYEPLRNVCRTLENRFASDEYVGIVLTRVWKKNPEAYATMMLDLSEDGSPTVQRYALMHLTTVRMHYNAYWNIPPVVLRTLPALHTLSFSTVDGDKKDYDWYEEATFHQQEVLRNLQGCTGLRHLTLQVSDAMTTWDASDPMLTLLIQAVMQMSQLTSLTFVGPSTHRNPNNDLPTLCTLVLEHTQAFGTLQRVCMHGLRVRAARALLAGTSIPSVRLAGEP